MTATTTTRRTLIAAAVPIAAGDADAERHRLAGEVKAAWVDLGHACDATDAAMGTPDEAEAESAQNAANTKLDNAIDALCNTPARTIHDLAAKARATKIDNGGMFDGLRQSIVDDLLGLDAGAGRA
jgi:hypothetical protein